MTTISADRSPAWATLEHALRQRRPVQLSYHGRERTVCPHALGWKNNKAMLLAYQTGGHTGTERRPSILESNGATSWWTTSTTFP